MDPRGGTKVCQDMVLLESFKGYTLAGVLDGHGPNGEVVVAFCRKFLCDYFNEHYREIDADPKAFLTTLTATCDKELNEAVDCMASGSTAVFMLYCKEVVYFSSVGDSRGILATSHPPDILASTQPPRGEDKALLQEIKVRRSIAPPDSELIAVQMTVDQKPEDPEELARIQQSGGVVLRLQDDSGKRVGPYRVWKVENMYPGIAMSRSLGDAIAHEIGVISTPILTSRQLVEGQDFFIVLGSDGLWDMMENQEVCDFVEAFRQRSVRGLQMPRYVDIVQPQNVCIAHLLCEEARARWLSIVEAEDVLIDDICCVVLELITHLPSKKHAPPRTIQPHKDFADLPGIEHGVRHLDPRSPLLKAHENEDTSIMKDNLETQPAAVVNDVRRSSVSEFKISK